MQNLIVFLKKHVLVIVLGAVVVFLLVQRNGFSGTRTFNSTASYDMGDSAIMESAQFSKKASPSRSSSSIVAPIAQGESVNPNQSDRKVVKNATMSLLVNDVRSAMKQISQQVSAAGGFIVSSNLSSPEEAASATISVRVPTDQLESILGQLRGMSVKVVQESVSGYDVTDQFTDSQARLKTLNDTKAKFEAMLASANTVDEILRVQQSIIQVQDQIDAIQGQLQYLENTSKTSLITIYLSTDELALPYAPSDAWRPQVVFKTAVRSLLLSLRGVANAVIWLAVYSPIIIVGLAVLFGLNKVLQKRK